MNLCIQCHVLCLTARQALFSEVAINSYKTIVNESIQYIN